MAVEDLMMALKNALERGETLEEAKLSLLNAGYRREEVEKASEALEKVRQKLPRPKFKPLPPPRPT